MAAPAMTDAPGAKLHATLGYQPLLLVPFV
jgi:hypothetical protein